MKKILHIAPFNTAGVPVTLVRAERKLGYDSRLITLGKSPFDFEEDICLNMSFINSGFISSVKKVFVNEKRTTSSGKKIIPDSIPPEWEPGNIFEKTLFNLRDLYWRNILPEKFRKNGLDIFDFDLYQLDGGSGFLRNSYFIKKLVSAGKKVLCLYLGSDMRRRGVIPFINKISMLNLTVEFDHLDLHPDINHIHFPVDLSKFQPVTLREKKSVVIGHAPSNRAAKGTNLILSVLNELKKRFSLEVKLIENLSHKDALMEKRKCDIFIDQVSELGYGVNALEAISMGIPVCTSLPDGFNSKYPGHPYIEINKEIINESLAGVIRDFGLRKDIGKKSRLWAEKQHSHLKIAEEIHSLIKKKSLHV